MTIADMTEDERLVFGGLVRMLLRSDGGISAEERERLHELAEELGADDFWDAVHKAQTALPDTEAVVRSVDRVERKPVQELIYDVLTDLAIAGTIVAAEASELEWLAQKWGIEPTELDRQPVDDWQEP